MQPLSVRASAFARGLSRLLPLFVGGLWGLGVAMPLLFSPTPLRPLWGASLGALGLALAGLAVLGTREGRLRAALVGQAGLAWALFFGLLGATLASGSGHLAPLVGFGLAGVLSSAAWTLQPEARWFRRSAERPPRQRALRTLAQATLFTGVFLGLFGFLVVQAEAALGIPRVHASDLVFWLCVALAVGLNLGQTGSGLWMAHEGNGTPLPIETAATLVVSGPYAYVRNPIASFGIAQGVLAGLALGSVALTLYAIAGGVLWHVLVRPVEEVDLERRFGRSYLQYKQSVPLWLPQPTPYRSSPGSRPS
jgi:protein-S-isoprenylcysteine O-methyltransferase Ste14